MSTNQVQLNYGALLGEAWDKLKGNLVAFIVAIIIVVAISLGVNIIPLVGTLVGFVISGPLALGLAYMSLNAARGDNVEIGQLFSGFNQFVPAALAGVLVNIFCFIGFFLIIIPGIVVAAMYMFTFFYLASGVDNFWAAMETSRTKVMENFVPWFLFMLILIGINILGAFLLGMGLLITVPLSWIAVAIAFDRFLHSNVESEATASEMPHQGGDV